MEIEVTPQVTNQLKTFLAKEQLSKAEVAQSLNRIVQRVAADERLLAELLGGREPQSPQNPHSLSLEQWEREFGEFIASQRPRNSALDISRERMYFEA